MRSLILCNEKTGILKKHIIYTCGNNMGDILIIVSGNGPPS